VSKNVSGAALAGHIGLLIFYLALWLILGIYLVPTLMKKLVVLMNDEVLLIFSLALCFLMALLAEEIGLSVELGAFLAGSLLAGTLHAERVEHLVTPVKNLFGSIFFISVGFMVQPEMIWKYLWVILLISAVTIIGKLLFLTLGGLAAGQPLDVSVESAASQTQVGEFSFILAGLGNSLKVTGAFLYPVIVAVSVITTFTTPFVLKAAGPLTRLLERKLPAQWLEAIDRYAQARAREPEEEVRDWPLFLRSYLGTFAFYGILSAGAIVAGVRVFLPNLYEIWGPEHALTAKLITCAIIYAALLILLPAMLRVQKRYFTALWLRGTANRVILSILLFLRQLFASLLLVAPAFVIFHVNPLYLLLGTIPILLIVRRSRHLTGRYLEFEAQFLANLNERKLAKWVEQELAQGRRYHWLTEQLMAIRVVCGPDYVNRGKTLGEVNWGDLLHIKVIKLLRGQKCHIIPGGETRIEAGDKMIITGSQRQLENFLNIMKERGIRQEEGTEMQTLKELIEGQAQEGVPEPRQVLLYGVTMTKDMPQTGKSIRASGIKKDWSAFMMGIERDMLPIIDPNPDMTLRAGDLVWVLGAQEMAAKLAAEGLLD
jgi:CPA2 family monovalent cation:H+ antiporter-2